MADSNAGDGKDEELLEELELLRAMWSVDEIEIQRPTCAKCEVSGDVAAARLTARLAPKTGGENQRQYLRCEVVITVPHGYPGDPEHPVLPQVRIGSSSGLTDARRATLLAALDDLLRCDLAGLPGALPAVLEAAQDQLTTWNDEGPTGLCPVCLVELGRGDDANHLRLPCYHILHAACFAQFWEAEWLRQRKDIQQNTPTVEENAALKITEAAVGCPECRQVVTWAAVPQIHPPLEHLLVAASTQKLMALPESDHHDEEMEAEKGVVEEDEVTTYIPWDGGASSSRQQQQKSTNHKVDLFEVVMARGLRTRLKPKWDARDQEGPVLRNGACGVIAEYVEGKDATYLRPEGTDYWLPLSGGRNNCKMVRIDQDMPRPLKAPSGWIHGEDCLGVDVKALTSPGSVKGQGAKPAGASSSVKGKASRKDGKKSKSKDAGGGYPPKDKLLGA